MTGLTAEEAEAISNVTTPRRVSVRTRLSRPLFRSRVSAGFPSPAENEFGIRLDFNQRFIRNPSATYYVEVIGDSMIGRGINEGDILLVDRSVTCTDGNVIIARVLGDFCVRVFRTNGERVWLEAANPKYKPIEITPEMDFDIYGRVMVSIQRH
ncbi:MAG: translesion error-prone DNA polymerase V autoproteolytic subunit [Blastocatellia bacterium]